MAQPKSAAVRDSKNFVTAFARGLEIIRAFDHDHPRLTVAEAAARTGLDRAVARRLLITLCEEGYAQHHGKNFELSPRILALGFTYLSALGLDQRLQPYLDDLSAKIGQAVSVSVLDGDETVFVARSEPVGSVMAYVVRSGLRLPAFSSSSGRVLLAGLPSEETRELLGKAILKPLTSHTKIDKAEVWKAIEETREQGYAYNEQELEEELIGVSVRDPPPRR